MAGGLKCSMKIKMFMSPLERIENFKALSFESTHPQTIIVGNSVMHIMHFKYIDILGFGQTL